MKTILYLVPDLMFGTRIEDAATRLGYQAIGIEKAADVEKMLTDYHPAFVLVTFDRTGNAWERVAVSARDAGIRAVAFGSHMNAGAFKRARELGCTEVIPNSRLSADLDRLLLKWAGT